MVARGKSSQQAVGPHTTDPLATLYASESRNRLGPNIGGQPDERPRELTVDPVDDHDESGTFQLHVLYLLFL